MSEGVIIRPSYGRFCIVNALGLIPLFIALFLMGFPVADFLGSYIALIGILFVCIIWVLGGSAFANMLLAITVSERGIGHVFPNNSFLRWDELRMFWRIYPLPFYAVFPGMFSFKGIFLPRTWLVSKPNQFMSAIAKYAPVDHPIRRRIVS
jgi:hypothetical protein